MEGPADLLERGVGVVDVGVEDVHVLQLQPLQRVLQTLLYVFAVGAHRRVAVTRARSQNLSPDNHFLSGHLEIFEASAQQSFRLSASIDLCGVEIIDASLEGQLDDALVCLEVGRVGAVGCSQGNCGDFEA